jgi:predicted branched-subunit amino acid permease
MSAALSQKVPGDTSTVHRMGIAYGVTDEIFGLSVLAEGPLRPAYSYGLIVVSVTGWVLGTVLGAAAGAILPHRLISALGVALYGMFIAIIIPPARDEVPVRITVFMAMVMSTIYTVVPVLRDLSGGMKIIIVTITVSSLAAIWMPRDTDNERRESS